MYTVIYEELRLFLVLSKKEENENFTDPKIFFYPLLYFGLYLILIINFDFHINYFLYKIRNIAYIYFKKYTILQKKCI